MAGIYTTRPWSIKPPLSVPVSLGHRQLRTIGNLWPLREGAGATAFDAFGRRAGTIRNGSWSADHLVFNGSSTDIVLPDPVTAEPLTLAAWARPSSDAINVLFSLTEGSTSLNFFIVYLGDGVTTAVDDELITIGHRIGGVATNTVSYTTSDRSELYDGRWHLIVVCATGSEYRIWLDGIPRTITVAQGSNHGRAAVNDADTMRFGSRRLSGADSIFFDGDLRTAMLGQRVPTDAEVRDWYANPHAIYQPRRVFIPTGAPSLLPPALIPPPVSMAGPVDRVPPPAIVW